MRISYIYALSVAFGATWLYMMTYPASIDVTSNIYAGKLYEEEAGITPVTAISFPSVMEGSLTGTETNCTAVWLLINTDTEDVIWNITALPTDMTITCYYETNDGLYEYEWAENILLSTKVDVTTDKDIKVWWSLDTNSAPEASYSFDINLYAGTA